MLVNQGTKFLQPTSEWVSFEFGGVVALHSCAICNLICGRLEVAGPSRWRPVSASASELAASWPWTVWRCWSSDGDALSVVRCRVGDEGDAVSASAEACLECVDLG